MRKIKIDKENNKLVLDISKVDKVKLSKLEGINAIQYVLSSLGHRQHVSVPKVNTSKPMHVVDRRIETRSSGYFLELFKQTFRTGNHKPLEQYRYFGIEIECFIELRELDLYRSDFGSNGSRECYDCEGSGTLTYSHRDSGHHIEQECQTCDGDGEVENEDCDGDDDSLFEAVHRELSRRIKNSQIRGVDIKRDGSLSHDDENYFPVEFTVLVRQDDFSNLEKLCSLLEDVGAVVNASCGLHVHIDMRGESKGDARGIGFKLEKYIHALASMVPETRRKNTYCKLQASTEDRYSAINLCSLDEHNTIEIRLHSATTNFEKIKNWTMILKTLIDKGEVLNRRCSINKFVKMFDGDLQEYIIKRIKMFSDDTEVKEFKKLADTEDVSINEVA